MPHVPSQLLSASVGRGHLEVWLIYCCGLEGKFSFTPELHCAGSLVTWGAASDLGVLCTPQSKLETLGLGISQSCQELFSTHIFKFISKVPLPHFYH
jgi:hypothetical protein